VQSTTNNLPLDGRSLKFTLLCLICMQVMGKVCSASMLEKRTCPGISLKKGKDSCCRPAGEWRTVGKTHVLPADLSIANSFLAACEKDPLTHSLTPPACSQHDIAAARSVCHCSSRAVSHLSLLNRRRAGAFH
jgi:hypothetical protein